MNVEDEIIKVLDTLFTKNVPSEIIEFIELKNLNNHINLKVQRKQNHQLKIYYNRRTNIYKIKINSKIKNFF